MNTYSNSYVMVLARTVDILLCGWIWRDYDVTISSMTGLALRTTKPLWSRLLGGFLNWLQTNHCELAIQADTERASQALLLLSGKMRCQK